MAGGGEGGDTAGRSWSAPSFPPMPPLLRQLATTRLLHLQRANPVLSTHALAQLAHQCATPGGALGPPVPDCSVVCAQHVRGLKTKERSDTCFF